MLLLLLLYFFFVRNFVAICRYEKFKIDSMMCFLRDHNTANIDNEFTQRISMFFWKNAHTLFNIHKKKNCLCSALRLLMITVGYTS